MAGVKSFLGCCGEPVLDTVRTFLSSENEIVSIRRCTHCQACWYYHLKEYPLLGDEYDRRAWYVRLTSEEAADLIAPSARAPSIAMFAGRAGIVRCEDGICTVEGVPDFLQ